MSYASGTAGRRRGPGAPGRTRAAGGAAWWGLALALVLAACAGAQGGGSDAGGGSGGGGTERTVLLTRKNESTIQVTESELNGNQIVRIKTIIRGEENSVVLDIDQPVYEVEIPLTLEQIMPPAASAQVRGPEGQFQDLLIAQWLQKAQEAMLAGDYNGALKQVDTVLQISPNHTQAHAMKGSVYYALGNYQLANEEWEYVLSLDPSNQEVLDMQEFLRNRSATQPPKLPGAPAGTTPQRRPSGGGPGAAPGGAAGGGTGGARAPQPPAGGSAQ